MRLMQSVRLPATALLIFGASMGCTGERTAEGSAAELEMATVPDDAIQVLGTSERITRIRDILSGADGTIWVLNSADPYLVAFGADGVVREAWGEQGEGPEEFRTPETLVRHPGTGEIWVYDRDMARNGLIRAHQEEGAWAEIGLPRDSLPANRLLYPHFAGEAVTRLWMETGADAIFAVRARPDSDEMTQFYQSDIYAVDPDDGSMANVLPIGDVMADPAERYPLTLLFMPYPLWDLCPADESFVLYDPLQNSVRRFGPTGEEGATITLPPERELEITFERIWRLVSRTMVEVIPSDQRPDTATLRTQFEAQWGLLGQQIASAFPEYVDLQCLQDGSVWIQPFDLDSDRFGYGHEWIRLHPDGTTDMVRLPDTFIALRFAPDRIWGTVADEFGVQSVAWLELPID